jgi:hypothetical protein
MSNPDVLAELRAWRDEFAKSHGYDVHAMAAVLRALDNAGERKVVHGEPRRPVKTRIPNLEEREPTEVSAAAANPNVSKTNAG